MQLDGKGGKFSFAQASYEMGPSSLMASISQDMSLGPHEPWIDVAGDRQIAVGGGGSPAQEISVTSDDRPMKRARTGSLDDDFGVDSGTDTGDLDISTEAFPQRPGKTWTDIGKICHKHIAALPVMSSCDNFILVLCHTDWQVLTHVWLWLCRW